MTSLHQCRNSLIIVIKEQVQTLNSLLVETNVKKEDIASALSCLDVNFRLFVTLDKDYCISSKCDVSIIEAADAESDEIFYLYTEAVKAARSVLEEDVDVDVHVVDSPDSESSCLQFPHPPNLEKQVDVDSHVTNSPELVSLCSQILPLPSLLSIPVRIPPLMSLVVHPCISAMIEHETNQCVTLPLSVPLASRPSSIASEPILQSSSHVTVPMSPSCSLSRCTVSPSRVSPSSPCFSDSSPVYSSQHVYSPTPRSFKCPLTCSSLRSIPAVFCFWLLYLVCGYILFRVWLDSCPFPTSQLLPSPNHVSAAMS